MTTTTYDYIVIGAGSAGSVSAWELARHGKHRVLVVESGKRISHRHTRGPAFYPHLFRDPRFSLPIETVPQEGLARRRIPLPNGRGLGGSSLINAMIWMPPSRADLLRWEEETGRGWTVQEMEAGLAAVESRYFDRPDKDFDSPFLSPSSQFLINAPESRQAIAPYRRTIRNGKRFSAWISQASAEDPPENMTVLRGGTVERLLLEQQRVAGVAIRIDDRNESAIATATRGVILCAGAIHSPAILLRSGIGDPESLREVGLPCIVESPNVGSNLQDHLLFPIVTAWNGPPLPSRFSHEERKEWWFQGAGPITSNIAEAGCFLTKQEGGVVEMHPPYMETNRCTEVQWHITPTHYLEYPIREIPAAAISVGVTPLHPKSRGTISIDREGNPRIDPCYLRDPEDRRELLEGVKWARDWLHAIRQGGGIGPEILPGEKRVTDSQLEAAISRYATTLYHYIGSCSAGPGPATVCRPDFSVQGCENLYICDASVLPSQPSGNTQASVMMLARLFAGRLFAEGF